MKKPRISLLIVLTFTVLAFTAGIFIGRNYGGKDISLSFPEEMNQVPATSVETQPSPLPSPVSSGSLVDINLASFEELTTLPGIGEDLAVEIIAYRASNGGFSHAEELMNIPGIGEKRLESLLHLITVGGTS